MNERFEAQEDPEQMALNRAKEIIDNNGLDLSVTIEEREIRLTDGVEWNPARIFHFISPSNPSIEWTMDIDADPTYLETELPDVLLNSYQERMGE